MEVGGRRYELACRGEQRRVGSGDAACPSTPRHRPLGGPRALLAPHGPGGGRLSQWGSGPGGPRGLQGFSPSKIPRAALAGGRLLNPRIAQTTDTHKTPAFQVCVATSETGCPRQRETRAGHGPGGFVPSADPQACLSCVGRRASAALSPKPPTAVPGPTVPGCLQKPHQRRISIFSLGKAEGPAPGTR